MNSTAKILVLGHRGLVGSAMCRLFDRLSVPYVTTNVDLTNRVLVDLVMSSDNPTHVVLAAAKVGGIVYNQKHGAESIYNNLLIQSNVIDSAYKYGVVKLLFLGSSCIYPRECPQPIKEEYLLSGLLEQTNSPYAVAKIAGITMCQAYNKQYGTKFISAMPTNLYGINDNFHLINSHVLPGLIHKFHLAKINKDESIVLWGDGSPKREFLFVDDLAEALLFLLDKYDDSEIINVGVGKDISIMELSQLIALVVGYHGDILWDSRYPNGTPIKVLDVSKMKSLGWEAKTSLLSGIEQTYKWFVDNYNRAKK